MVPNGWEITTLGEHVTISSGYSPSKYTLAEAGSFPFVKVEDMNNCNKYQELSREYTESNGSSVAKGAVIFPKRGAAIMNNKVRITDVAMYLDTNMMALTPKKSVFTEYLYYTLIKEELHKIADTSTIPQINNKHILPYRFKLPPLPEQRKIAKILSTWDKAITSTEKLIATSKQQKKSLMQHLLTGKKRLLNPETGKAFEGDWEEVKLGDISSIYDGTHSTPNYVEQGIPFYSVEHLTRGDFSVTKFITEEVFEKENKRVKLERNDILMTRIGDIGTAKCLTWDVCASFYVSLALIKANKIKFNSQYLGFFINSRGFHRELHKRTIHVAFPKKINLGEISNCYVLLPTINEQQKIASVLTASDKEIELLHAKLAHLKQEKKALMQQLLTGKRRVKVKKIITEATC